MDAQSAHNQIHNAIDSLEQNLADSHHAYEFLKDLPGDYRVGIDALRDGLDSKSQDVQLVCVLAIGRLGRGSEWALNAIAEIAEDSNMHVMVRSAAYFAISSLETPEAANKLAKVLEAALENDWDQSRASDALRALALMGGLAVEHRGLFFRAWNKVKDLEGSFASFEVASAYGKFLNQLKTDYYHYVKLGLSFNLKLDNLTEGNPRDLDCDKIIKQFGSWNLIQDQYFVYSRDNTAQRQALPDRLGMFLGLAPLAMRTLIFQHESGDIAACGCLDEFSLGSSVINKFEVFAETLSNAFQLDPSKVQWCTHTRDSRDSSLIGIMNPVSFRITDGETRIRHVSWGRGPDLAEYFGDAFEAIKEHIAQGDFVPEHFTEFVAGLRYEDRVRAQHQALRDSSPEGRLHYDNLPQDFGKKIIPVISRSAPPKLIVSDAYQYADSFNSETYITDFSGNLDYQLLEALTMVAQEELCLPLPESLFLDQAMDKFDYPDGHGRGDSNALNVDPFSSGIVLLREYNTDSGTTRLLTNVPRTVFGGSFGYEWGYWGQGPSELALNALNLFVPPGSDGFSEIDADKVFWPPTKFTFASLTGQVLAWEFYNDFITKVPRGGGFISSERIQDWILTKAHEARQEFL